jgi:amino acid transporter
MTTATKPKGLTASRIVLMVVAAVAPMAAIVGTVPLSFALGTGIGTPATYAVAGMILLCFAVGYAAMGRRIVSHGGFYAYISQGLGRIPAVAGASVAVLSYNVFTVGAIATFGYFSNIAVETLFSTSVPWEVFSAAALVLVLVLGRRQIDVSVRSLFLLLVAEFAVLMVLNVAIVLNQGAAAFPSESWAPHNAFGGAVGVTLMLAFTSFLGFEATSLYAKEARNPKRTIPRATYAAVLLIAVFYTLTTWISVGGVGVKNFSAFMGQLVKGGQLGEMYFALNAQYVNMFTTKVMTVLLCTSILASLLAVHNATSRYMAALGKEKVLPSWLGRTGRSAAPGNASLAQTGFNLVVLGIAALAGANPYLGLGSTAIGLGSLGVIVLQGTAAVSVIAYFLRHREGRHWWRTFLAPGIGAAGLIGALVLVLQKFAVLTGSTSEWVARLPWLVAIAAVAGAGWAAWLRSHRPSVYARLGSDVDETHEQAQQPHLHTASEAVSELV